MLAYEMEYATIWDHMLATVIGCAIALVGTVVPLPPRIAAAEIRSRVQYFSSTISSLLEDMVISWQHQHYVQQRQEDTQHHQQQKPQQQQQQQQQRKGVIRKGEDPKDTINNFYIQIEQRLHQQQQRQGANKEGQIDDSNDSIKTYLAAKHSGSDNGNNSRNKHWRKIRLMLRAVRAFKTYKDSDPGQGWFRQVRKWVF
jgi:hypothetical protein